MAEGGEQFQEKTEPATPKRLEDARRKGQVARSRELATTCLLLGSGAAMLGLGPGVVADVGHIMTRSFTTLPGRVDSGRFLLAVLSEAVIDALVLVAPFFALTVVLSVAGSIALGGINLALEAMSFKWEKLDPVKGMKRVFSRRGLMELVKALAKFVLIAGTASMLLWLGTDQVVGLGSRDIGTGLRDVGFILVAAFLVLSATTVLISLVDVPFQIWQHAHGLRMTKQEVKDEMKQTEGKPEVKGRIRTLQREMANRRMLEAVPDADVVVTNPEHFAVALRYRAGETRAPRVVAKGRGFVAAAIRRAALEHGVPMLRAPELARSIYRHTRLGREIPTGLYQAVAEVLAHVMRIGNGLATAIDAERLDIPHDLRVGPDDVVPNRG